MKTSDFFYELPEELIAQIPAEPRDSSRLMVYHRKDGRVEDRIFRDIIEYLRPGDALVINETRVLPVRLIGRKRGGSAEVECLLLKRLDGNRWEALIRPAKRLREGMYVDFSEDLCCSIEEKRDEYITEKEKEIGYRPLGDSSDEKEWLELLAFLKALKAERGERQQ